MAEFPRPFAVAALLRNDVKTIAAKLESKSGLITQNPIFIAPYDLVIEEVSVVFMTKPDAGNLNVGVDNLDPDEVVDNFNLTTLTNYQPKKLTLVGTSVLKGQNLWAKVSAALSIPGAGGGITINYRPV
jgi:hypothetical protein